MGPGIRRRCLQAVGGFLGRGGPAKDKERGIFSDPSKIHKIYHEGKRYRVEGPHLPSPSAQRTPVLYQASSSASGRAFAARNAEAVFIISANPDVAALQIADTRRQAVEAGRNPEDIKFFQGLSFIIGGTEEEALAKAREYDQYVSVDGYLAHAAIVDKTGRVYPADTPLSEVDTNTMKGFQEWVSKAITDREPVVGDLARLQAQNTPVDGTPEQIADELEKWQAAGVDGINVINWVIPGSFEEFADKVMPVLRERGLAQSEYAEGPLRQKLFGAARLTTATPPPGTAVPSPPVRAAGHKPTPPVPPRKPAPSAPAPSTTVAFIFGVVGRLIGLRPRILLIMTGER